MPSPDTTGRRTLWTAYACLGLSMALVGSYVGLSRLLVATFPIFLLAWMRFGIAAVAMAGWVRRAPHEPRLTRRDRQLLFLESFLGNFLFSICMLGGVAATSALAAGVVMAAIPAAVALLSRGFLGERISPRVGAAIAMAVMGIAVLALARHGDVALSDTAAQVSAPWWGYALLVGAVLCEASYVVIGKTLAARVSPRRISALINLWGFALVTPLGLWQARDFDATAVGASMWMLLIFYALAASMATVWLWMQGSRHVPSAQAGVFTVMLPIGSAAVGVGLLGEPFGAAHAVAFALALGGLITATWPEQATAPGPERTRSG